MFSRSALVALALMAAAHSAACAGPITFDFTASLSQPLNGTKDVSGSFTINSDPRQVNNYGQGALFTEGGSDVALTVNIAGQTFNLANTPTNPYVVLAGLYQWPGETSSSSSWDELGVYGTQYKGGNANSFNLSFYVPMALVSITNLRTFEGPPPGSESGIGGALQTSGPPGQGYSGTIASLTLVSTPEPGSIVIFSVFALAAAFQLHRSRRRGASR